jgi:hypothetical protein
VLMPSNWVKRGTRVRVRQFKDDSAEDYNRYHLKRGQRPAQSHLWRVEDMDGEVVRQCGYCISEQSALDSANRFNLWVVDDDFDKGNVA